jgi:inorganic pyrophosphatase/exopolyphosphatase
MDFNYLKEIRNLYEKNSNILEISFILGNNTCDMDSALSAYLLSIGKNIKKGTIILDKKGNPSINEETKYLCLPVLNVKRGHLKHRIDVKYVFDHFGIDENDFWYITDDIFNPNSLFQYKNNINVNNIKTSLILVDHTILTDEQKYLSEYVIGIYDHHLLSEYNGQYKNLKNLNIMYPVGSCTSLILTEYFNDDNFPVKIVSPVLSVTAILLDTKNFKEDFYENRWVDFDSIIFKKIKKIIKNEDENFKIKSYYKEIKDLKHDITKNLELGFEPLFSKDQKFFNWNNNQKAVWSSLPVSFHEIKKKFGGKKILKHYMDFYKGKNKVEQKKTFFITNSSLGNNQKLFTIFNPFKIPFKKDEIQKELVKHSEKEFYSVDIKNIVDENEKPNGEVCNIVLADTYSRKSFEPVLKSFFSNKLLENESNADEAK